MLYIENTLNLGFLTIESEGNKIVTLDMSIKKSIEAHAITRDGCTQVGMGFVVGACAGRVYRNTWIRDNDDGI